MLEDWARARGAGEVGEDRRGCAIAALVTLAVWVLVMGVALRLAGRL